MPTSPTPHLPASLERAVNEFFEHNEYAREWAVYPDVTEEMDETMPACHGMSEEFVRFLRARGFRAEVIEADQSLHPDADYHRWARVSVRDDTFNVDWTARQYHNLVWPLAPELQALPCPMVWTGDGPAHPLVEFTRQQVIELDAPTVSPAPAAPSVEL